jgi:hypothetical protein
MDPRKADMNRPADTNGSSRAAGIRRDIDETRCRMDRTIDELQMRLSPRYIADQAVCAIKDKARDVRQSMFNTIKDHPIPSALIGSGVACLAACIVRDRMNRKPMAYDAQVRRDNAMYQAGYARDQGVGMTPSHGDASYEYGDESCHESHGRIARAAGAVRERASELGHRVGEMASGVRHRVGDAASSVGHRVSDTAHTVARRTKDTARYATHKARETYDEHPIMLGLAAVGLGIAAGLAIPATRRENRWLGSTRDQLFRKAREIGEDTLERGKSAAKSVAACATDEAKHQLGKETGSTGRSASQAAPSMSPASPAARAPGGPREIERFGRTEASRDRSSSTSPSKSGSSASSSSAAGKSAV